MKIAFVASCFYPIRGGAEDSIFNITSELAKKHDVHVFTSDRYCGKKFKKFEIIKGIKVHRFRQLFRHKYYLAFYPSIVKGIMKEEFDVIHFCSIGFLQHDLIVKKKFGKSKLVNTPWGPFMALNKYGPLQTLFKTLIESYEKKINKKYDAVIQINPSQEKWMVEKGIPKERIKFIPVGMKKENMEKISPKKFIKKYNLEKNLIISYLGRIQRYKGLDQIIKALPSLDKKVKFVAAGKDVGDKKRLLELAEKLGVRDQVLFLGLVSEKEKYEMLEASEIFVFPSEWEAFGIVTLEAMAHGNAIISTKTEGSLFLVGKDNGLLYDYKNVGQLKESLLKLIKNKKLRIKMGEINRKKAKEFSWDRIASQIEELYEKLLRK